MIVVGFLGGSDALAGVIARRAAAGAAGAARAAEAARAAGAAGAPGAAGPAGGTGARVEMVGVATPGRDGDSRLLELAAASVGHATVLRTGAESLDSNDLELALRYLPDVRCIVLVRPPARLLSTALAGADWAGATLVVIGPLDTEAVMTLDDAGLTSGVAGRSSDASGPSAASPSSAAGPIVLDPPSDSDPDGTFAGFVAALAVRLDAGDPPDAAFRSTVAALAVDSA